MLQLGDQTVVSYFRKIESIITILTSLASPMSNDDAVTYAINGLSDKYKHVAGIIAHRYPFPDLSTVTFMMTTEEMRLKFKS